VSAVCWLMTTHFDFHSDRRLSLLADLNLLVVTLNTSPITCVSLAC
jgi:hypothetical protein